MIMGVILYNRVPLPSYLMIKFIDNRGFIFTQNYIHNHPEI